MTANMSSQVLQDSLIPEVFYNSTKFKDGIFGFKFGVKFGVEQFNQAFVAWDLDSLIVKNKHSDNDDDVYHGIYSTVPFEFNDSIVNLMKELTLHGHQNVILSAIEKELLNEQITYFSNQVQGFPPGTLEDSLSLSKINQHSYLELMNLWYNYTNTLFILTFLKNKQNVIISKENNASNKLNKYDYQECINKNFQSCHKKCLKIYISDKKENVIVAVENNYFDIAILYTKPSDLRFIFQSIGSGFGGMRMICFLTGSRSKNFFLNHGLKYFIKQKNIEFPTPESFIRPFKALF